ncbi:MAG: hypothetical protein ABIB71_00770, partial [Candidatus Woesearchaeota archaeon]
MKKRWVVAILVVCLIAMAFLRFTGFSTKECSADLYYIGNVDRKEHNLSYNPENRNQKLFTLNGLNLYPAGCKDGVGIRLVKGSDMVRLESDGLVLNGFLNNKEMGNISEAQGIIFSLKNDTLNISVPEGIKPGSIVVSI